MQGLLRGSGCGWGWMHGGVVFQLEGRLQVFPYLFSRLGTGMCVMHGAGYWCAHGAGHGCRANGAWNACHGRWIA